MPITNQVLYQSTPMTVDVYTHQEYPKMLKHPSGHLMVIPEGSGAPEAEAKAKGEGWMESTADYGVETCPAAPAAVPGGWLQQGWVAPAPPAAPTPAPETTGAEAPPEGEPTTEETPERPYGQRRR